MQTDELAATTASPSLNTFPEALSCVHCVRCVLHISGHLFPPLSQSISVKAAGLLRSAQAGKRLRGPRSLIQSPKSPFEKPAAQNKCCSLSRVCRRLRPPPQKWPRWICLMLSFRVAHGGYKIGFQAFQQCSPFLLSCPAIRKRASSLLEVDQIRCI